MNSPPVAQACADPSLLEPDLEQTSNPQEFERLWRGFMTARVTLGLVLLLLQGTLYFLETSKNTLQLLICTGYFAAALATRLLASAHLMSKTFDLRWISIIGVDILAFGALQAAPGNSINYTPLFALPVLMASVLGPLLLAMGAAASVTLLLFVHAAWLSLDLPGDTAARFLQAALTGAGCFVISFLANQIATRLSNVELLAQRNQLAARVLRQVNELVIESLTDGILVVDQNSMVRSANPAARLLLGAHNTLKNSPFYLTSLIGWQSLVNLMKLSFSEQDARQADVTIHHAGQGPRHIHARTQLTTAQGSSGESLCVMFLQDQREIEARMRTEKMASMGRMSAAVAHEIRNPLAAIVQANALLNEDLSEPRHKQLTQMVQQNAKRLEKIVADVLHIGRLRQHENGMTNSMLELNSAVTIICHDWQKQTPNESPLRVDLFPASVEVNFESEHLRRVLLNLLDNAQRYASHQLEAIQVSVDLSKSRQGVLSIWSDGQPMDQSVERHIFEPFFSSESRSSGLGLYICRELCEGYGASIAYYRVQRKVGGKPVEGNEFFVTFKTKSSQANVNRDGNKLPVTLWL